MESSGGEKPEVSVAVALRRLRERQARAAVVAKQSAEYEAGREMMPLKECMSAAKSSELQSRRLMIEAFVAVVFALEFGNLFLLPRLGIEWFFICLAVGLLMVIAGIAIVGFTRVPEILLSDWILRRKKRAFLKKAKEFGLAEIRRNYHINLRTGSITPRKSTRRVPSL
jgi:hypothetical protein